MTGDHMSNDPLRPAVADDQDTWTGSPLGPLHRLSWDERVRETASVLDALESDHESAIVVAVVGVTRDEIAHVTGNDHTVPVPLDVPASEDDTPKKGKKRRGKKDKGGKGKKRKGKGKKGKKRGKKQASLTELPYRHGHPVARILPYVPVPLNYDPIPTPVDTAPSDEPEIPPVTPPETVSDEPENTTVVLVEEVVESDTASVSDEDEAVAVLEALEALESLEALAALAALDVDLEDDEPETVPESVEDEPANEGSGEEPESDSDESDIDESVAEIVVETEESVELVDEVTSDATDDLPDEEVGGGTVEVVTWVAETQESEMLNSAGDVLDTTVVESVESGGEPVTSVICPTCEVDLTEGVDEWRQRVNASYEFMLLVEFRCRESQRTAGGSVSQEFMNGERAGLELGLAHLRSALTTVLLSHHKHMAFVVAEKAKGHLNPGISI